MQTLKKENCGIDGKLIITLADITNPEAENLQRMIGNYRESGSNPREMKRLIDILNNKFAVEQFELHNIIPTAGRAVLAARLANDTSFTGIANYGALGTNNTTPANGDTQLAAEVYRKLLASLTNSDNIAYITQFYTAAEVSGTFSETGLFIDGTGSANTGELFSRALISVTKTTAQTLTIDHVITFS